MTMRPLPRPATTAECYLAAVVDRLDQLVSVVAELSGRLGPSNQPAGGPEEGGPVRLLEPDIPPPPAGLPGRVTEPAPPKFGPGSGRDVWAAYADRLGVRYPPGSGQRDIIAAVEAAQQAA